MARGVELVDLRLKGRTLWDFASIWSAGCFEISRQVHGAGTPRAARRGDEKMEAGNREPQFIVMTNRSPGIVSEATGFRP
jgi:hypothetical protein